MVVKPPFFILIFSIKNPREKTSPWGNIIQQKLL